MKALRALRTLVLVSSRPSRTPSFVTDFQRRLYGAQPQRDVPSDSPDATAAALLERESNDDSGSLFDSSEYPSLDDAVSPTADDAKATPQPLWDEAYRDKADSTIFGREIQKKRKKRRDNVPDEDLKNQQATLLAKTLLEASLRQPDHADVDEGKVTVLEEHQKSLSVGIIGAPNAGKSCLTNCMVGTKVAAVSRKTNTTSHEVLGVMTKGDTQICFFDTPGLMLRKSGYPSNDIKLRVDSAWSSINLYDVLIVIFDTDRHLNRPDSRVTRLIERMGKLPLPNQKRVLCMSKIDLVGKKNELLKVREEFKDLPGYERIFMVSGLRGAGVKDLSRYLMDQAVKRPWDEDPTIMSEDIMKSISLEVVRERLLDHIHQEIPYQIEHHLTGWDELSNGFLRIEQRLVTHKESQKKIIVGKKGSKIGRIGMEAKAELESIFKRDVHVILNVKLKK